MPSDRSLPLCPPPPWPACLALLLVWLLPGLFGSEPWKPDGAYTFGIINHIVQSGDWVVPQLAGEPFMEKPPLFFVSAALFANAFGHWLPLHDAARLASAFYIGLAFAALTLSANLLYGQRHGWWAPVLLIGTLGFPVRAHQLITDTALFAGISWGLYGLLLAPRRPLLAGVALGLGAAAALLSKGLLGPGLLGLAALLLPLFSAPYRQRQYLGTLLVAALVGLPLPLLWMVALWQRSPKLFELWLLVNNLGRFSGASRLGPSADSWFYLKTLPWYAFPVLPLALYGLWKQRRHGIVTTLAAPLTLFVIALAVLSSAADARELYAMPLLAPLCLIAPSGLLAGADLKTGARVTWTVLSCALAGLLLLVGFTLASGQPAALLHWLQRWVAGWEPHWESGFWLGGLGALALLAWLWRQGPTQRLGGHAWRWSLLLTLCWALAFTIWLPAVDVGMGYQVPFRQLARPLQNAARQDCIASFALGEPQRALLDYYAGITTRRIEATRDATACTWLLVQTRDSGLPMPLVMLGYQPDAIAARPGDDKERFLLYSIPESVGTLEQFFAPRLRHPEHKGRGWTPQTGDTAYHAN